MIENIRHWWQTHSVGERGLMAVLGIVVLLVLLWLGVWRPVESGLTAGWARQSASQDRLAAVKSRVAALRRIPKGEAQGRPPIDQLIGQTAAEAGFTLDHATPQGTGRMSVNIASARMSALLPWIARLEAAGVSVQTITIVPGASDGTVVMQAVFQENAP